MKLSLALRLNATPRVAFVGAGGKTSGIFIIGRQLLEAKQGISSVLISTTTRMGLFQTKYADHHIIVDSNAKLVELKESFPKGLVMVTGQPVEGNHFMVTRLNGIPAEEMIMLANAHALPLLIEADGSKTLPLKAPAAYEPVIPEFVDLVVVIAGLTGIGKPLTEQWVHRPKIFAELSGLGLGDCITPQALMKVLKHTMGGLKNIPQQARRVMLFNRADTQELQSIAQEMATPLLEDYHAVIVGSYGQPLANLPTEESIEWHSSHLLSRTNIQEEVISVHEATAGVILAAGGSQRYGLPKQLLVWQGEPLIKRVAQTALQAGLSQVIVVTGAVDDPIREALRGMPVQIVHNPAWQEGQSTSVKAGLSALSENICACLFLLADQPRVKVDLLKNLLKLHTETLSPIIAPQVSGQRANPVLFDRVTFNDLKAVTGDQGGRGLFSRFPVAWLPWHDDYFTLDIDTPADYERLIRE